jgi:hypothetical protein
MKDINIRLIVGQTYLFFGYMQDQKTLLPKKFETWKGRLEQEDDVTVIGLKV